MPIDRRQFLGLAGYSAAGLALAGCGGFSGR
ncbi:twin-arginine translocation signal domain-containing protein [Motilibacter aurantiacus]|nr:twin-arginine translocation signal domain-containing protein [Motilibacter aurantiacus]NHC44365.1 twin-arginine translocation signal domain-containing protein [Motilibacter aurantiacus]